MVGSVTLIFVKLLTENHNINALFELKTFAFDFRSNSYIRNEIMLQPHTLSNGKWQYILNWNV